MGTGSSRSQETSICLDEDTFGKINKQLPNTSVPIEIKPRRRLNGAVNRNSLRGDSANRSSSFFSNLSSNKNESHASFLSLNKSEYKRQNEKLRHELYDLKSKMSSQIQGLLTSNKTLKNQNTKLKSEIDQVRVSKQRIHEELLCALDSQLAMRQNVKLYRSKVTELENVITIKSVDHSSKDSVKFSDILNTHIMVSFSEFIVSIQDNFLLNTFLEQRVERKSVGILVCPDLPPHLAEQILAELLSQFAMLTSSYKLTDITLDLPDPSLDSLIIIDSDQCSHGCHLNSSKPIHHLCYTYPRRGLPPIEKKTARYTKYSVINSAVKISVQTFVQHFWQSESPVPLVFDYAMFFMRRFSVLTKHRAVLVAPQTSSHDFTELDYNIHHMKSSLFVSCSPEDAMVFCSHLMKRYEGELVVVCEVTANTSYHEIALQILSSLCYQIGMDLKYLDLTEELLFDLINYLSLFFKVVVIVFVPSPTTSPTLELFLRGQQHSRSSCIILAQSTSVQVVQQCDSVFLSTSHTPAVRMLANIRPVKVLLSALPTELVGLGEVVVQFLTVFQTGLADVCLASLLKCGVITYLQLSCCLRTLGIIRSDRGLVELSPRYLSVPSPLMAENLVSPFLEHLSTCPCPHLHLNDLKPLLILTKSTRMGQVIGSNPEALAYSVYHQTSSQLSLVLCVGDYSGYPIGEQILIYRILSHLFATASPYQCLLYAQKARDIQCRTDAEPCFKSQLIRCKLYATNGSRIAMAEIVLHKIYCQSMLLDQLNEAVQLLLAHSGLAKSLSRSSLAARFFERAVGVFEHHTQVWEISQVFGYCTLLHIVRRDEAIEDALHGVLERCSGRTPPHLVSRILISYASVHAANRHYTNSLSVVEYMKRTGLANKDSLRLQAVCYAHLGRFTSAAEVYRELFGGRVSVSVLVTDRQTGEDLYNYCIVLVHLRYFGSAYDIAKILTNSTAGGVISTRCCRLLGYLRSVISLCKPLSGHYRESAII